METPKLCLIDSDIIAYRSAAAIEKRSIVVEHKDSGRKKVFDTRTDFYGRGKKKDGGWLAETNAEKGSKYTADDFIITDQRESEPVQNALHIAKTTIEGIMNSCNADDYICILEDETSENFRNEIATIHKYKDRDAEKPEHLYAVKDYIKNYHNCIVATDVETDDLLSILALERNGIQCTLDKDAGQCSGTWIFDWTKMEKPFYIPKGVGAVWKDDKGKVRAYGLKSLCNQMLCGDRADSIFPTYLCEDKFGEVSSFGILEMLKTPKQCLAIVAAKYKEWYPEPITYSHWETGEELTKDWLQIAEEIFALLWMKRSLDDVVTFEKLLKMYKVDYE